MDNLQKITNKLQKRFIQLTTLNILFNPFLSTPPFIPVPQQPPSISKNLTNTRTYSPEEKLENFYQFFKNEKNINFLDEINFEKGFRRDRLQESYLNKKLTPQDIYEIGKRLQG